MGYLLLVFLPVIAGCIWLTVRIWKFTPPGPPPVRVELVAPEQPRILAPEQPVEAPQQPTSAAQQPAPPTEPAAPAYIRRWGLQRRASVISDKASWQSQFDQLGK